MGDMCAKPARIRFETCIANAYRIARSDVSYKESLFLTDSDSDSESSADSSSDSDSSEVEEIQGQALQITIAPVSPVKVNPSPMIPQYVSPLGYGVPEPRRQPPNLIVPARPDWTATNPNIVCYNCENSGNYEYRCPRPGVALDIQAEHSQRINANSGRRKSYPPRSRQSENDNQVQQGVEFLRR